MTDNPHKPEWTPDNAGDEFASQVMKGVIGEHDGFTKLSPMDNAPRRNINVDAYVEGVLAGNRATLARAITLVESNAPHHLESAQQLLQQLLPHTGQSIRIGITGVPGAGKSTFIDTFGTYLTSHGYKVAVLAIDPSSSITHGSILGDKTRMETLAHNEKAFIRPSPTGGMLGGVARKTRESILVCEAAGYDVILVETVGTGQSEITVRSMVDFFLLLLITGAGDELQGIKKGVIEIADALVINKADGDNKIPAQAARAEYNRVLHFLTSATQGWQTQAHIVSALTGEGIEKIWNVIQAFDENTKQSGVFTKRRQSQIREWLHTVVENQLVEFFFHHPKIQSALPNIEQAVINGDLPATAGAQQLLRMILSNTEVQEDE
jgi:LAO/AO transport system kinase